MWTLSGEAMHKAWANNLTDNGKPVMPWSQLSNITQTAWNVLAATVSSEIKKVTGASGDDKISWILGMTDDKEKDRLYKLLYNMGHRIR